MMLFFKSMIVACCTSVIWANVSLVTDFASLVGPGHNTKKAFEHAISADTPLVIKFYLVGCGPCEATDNAYAKMAQAFKGKATFITLDVIKYDEIAKLFNIKKLPSWVIFAQKKKLAFIKGSQNMGDVQKILAQYLVHHPKIQK